MEKWSLRRGGRLREVVAKGGSTVSPFATFLSGTGGLPQNRDGSHVVLTLPIRLLGVNDPCVR